MDPYSDVEALTIEVRTYSFLSFRLQEKNHRRLLTRNSSFALM